MGHSPGDGVGDPVQGGTYVPVGVDGEVMPGEGLDGLTHGAVYVPAGEDGVAVPTAQAGSNHFLGSGDPDREDGSTLPVSDGVDAAAVGLGQVGGVHDQGKAAAQQALDNGVADGEDAGVLRRGVGGLGEEGKPDFIGRDDGGSKAGLEASGHHGLADAGQAAEHDEPGRGNGRKTGQLPLYLGGSGSGMG